MPGEPADPFGGPRSHWGGRLARAVRAAVFEGAVLDRERRAEYDGPPLHPATVPGCELADALGS